MSCCFVATVLPLRQESFIDAILCFCIFACLCYIQSFLVSFFVFELLVMRQHQNELCCHSDKNLSNRLDYLSRLPFASLFIDNSWLITETVSNLQENQSSSGRLPAGAATTPTSTFTCCSTLHWRVQGLEWRQLLNYAVECRSYQFEDPQRFGVQSKQWKWRQWRYRL